MKTITIETLEVTALRFDEKLEQARAKAFFSYGLENRYHTGQADAFCEIAACFLHIG